MLVTNTPQQRAHGYGTGKTFKPWCRWSHSLHKPEWTWCFFPKKMQCIGYKCKQLIQIKREKITSACYWHYSCAWELQPWMESWVLSPQGYRSRGQDEPKGTGRPWRGDQEPAASPAGSSGFPPAQYWPPLQEVAKRFLKRIRLHKNINLYTYLITPHFY